MREMNNTCIEVLPAYLDKSKVQTIRKAWEHTYKGLMNENPMNPNDCAYCGKEIIDKEYHDHSKEINETIVKPPEYKVGDEVKVYWKKDNKEEIFCNESGMPIEEDSGYCVDCIGTEEKREGKFFCESFNKLLGTVKITEVFEIEMGKDEQGYYGVAPFMTNKQYLNVSKKLVVDCANKELAKLDGFKSAEDMFKWFDKNYDLSSPKKFYVYRWEWLK